MIRVRLGRAGSTDGSLREGTGGPMVMRWVGGCGAVVVSAVLVSGLLLGCGASDIDSDSSLDDAKGGLEESALAGGRGSLDQERSGTLGLPGSQGPLEDINFDYDSVELDEQSRAILQRNRDWLEANPNARVEIEGHCDERGTIEYNLALGARRAASAKEYLTALGISTSRITTISYGEELPLCRDATEACMSRNRRGHFVVFE